MTFKLATDAAADYPTTQGLQKFADEVLEKSGGRLKSKFIRVRSLGMKMLTCSSFSSVLWILPNPLWRRWHSFVMI